MMPSEQQQPEAPQSPELQEFLAAEPTADAPEQPQQEAAPEFEVVVEQPSVPEPQPVDPKRKDYSHVDAQVESPEIQRRFAQLKWKAENAERLAAKREREAQAAMDAARALYARSIAQSKENHVIATNAVSIAKEKVTNDKAAALAELKDAQANGDAERTANAIARLSRASVEAAQVESVTVPESPIIPEEVGRYQQLEQYLSEQAKQPEPQPPPPQVPQEYVQAFQSWQAQNQWYKPSVQLQPGTLDHRKSLIAEQLSAIIESEGKAFGTAEHFAELQSRLQFQVPGAQQPVAQPQQTPAVTRQAPTVRQSPAVAPIGVSRGSGPRQTVKISPEAAAIAEEFGMSPQEWVKYSQGPNV